MLKEAIEERKANIGVPGAVVKKSVEIDLEIDAYIPDTYIKDGHQKIEMYKRFRGSETLEDIEELQAEMLDRFGEYPEEVSCLFQIAEIKQSKQEVTILVNDQVTNTIDGSKIFKIGSQFGRNVSLGMEGQRLKIVIKVKEYKNSQWLNIAFEMMKGLSLAKRGHENPVN
jgi:transcription-repair coupling factor (superfamily II helicase)